MWKINELKRNFPLGLVSKMTFLRAVTTEGRINSTATDQPNKTIWKVWAVTLATNATLCTTPSRSTHHDLCLMHVTLQLLVTNGRAFNIDEVESWN